MTTWNHPVGNFLVDMTTFSKVQSEVESVEPAIADPPLVAEIVMAVVETTAATQ